MKSVITILPYRIWGLQASPANTGHPVWLHSLPCPLQMDFRKAVFSVIVSINQKPVLGKELLIYTKLCTSIYFNIFLNSNVAFLWTYSYETTKRPLLMKVSVKLCCGSWSSSEFSVAVHVPRSGLNLLAGICSHRTSNFFLTEITLLEQKFTPFNNAIVQASAVSKFTQYLEGIWINSELIETCIHFLLLNSEEEGLG